MESQIVSVINKEDLKSGISQIWMHNQPVIVSSEEISWCENFNEDFNEIFNPIRISEKILISSGFLKKEDKSYEYSVDKNIQITLNPDNLISLKIKNKITVENLLWLHEIQEICYILTTNKIKIVLPRNHKNKEQL